MCLGEHWYILKLKKNAIILSILAVILIFSTENETTVEKYVSYFQSTQNG